MTKSITIFLLLFAFTKMVALPTDSIVKKDYKNIIRWNVTPMAVVGPKSIVLGYERIVKPWQSFSINLGYLEKAPLENADGIPLEIFDHSNKGGFDISLDYRFYFKKRNKYKAPDGLYWGPYTSYISIWQDASVDLLDNNAVVNTVHFNARFSMFNLGAQLGYQFVIKERFTIDLILMGPSYAYYDMNLALKYEQTFNPDDPFYQDLLELINESSPALANFIRKGEIDASGRLKFHYYGFRYGVQLGYRF